MGLIKDTIRAQYCFVYLPPWGVEFYEKIFVLLDLFIEVGIGENKNTLVELSSEDRVNTDSNQCK